MIFPGIFVLFLQHILTYKYNVLRFVSLFLEMGAHLDDIMFCLYKNRQYVYIKCSIIYFRFLWSVCSVTHFVFDNFMKFTNEVQFIFVFHFTCLERERGNGSIISTFWKIQRKKKTIQWLIRKQSVTTMEYPIILSKDMDKISKMWHYETLHFYIQKEKFNSNFHRKTFYLNVQLY